MIKIRTEISDIKHGVVGGRGERKSMKPKTASLRASIKLVYLYSS